MRVLVTGGAGFIGSHVCEALLENNHTPVVFDDLSTGSRDWVPTGAPFVEGDIKNLDALQHAMRGVDAVTHLAAMARSGPSTDLLDECIDANVIGTANVLKAMKDNNVSQIIYSGSSTFYGSSPTPHRVGQQGNFLNYYGLSKYFGEELVNVFCRENGVNSTILRYFNVYGPRQPRTGVYALVVGIFLEAAAAGKPLVVHGDGTQRRDFVHVRDVAQANVAALERSPGGQNTYNVGTGTDVSIIELARMISTQIDFGERRRGDADNTLAEISKTVEELGWRPRIPLDEGISELQTGA